MSPLLALVVAAAPYFFTERHTLVRAVVEPAAASSTGAAPVRELARATLPLPGLVMGHAQRDGEAVAVLCAPDLVTTDGAGGCPIWFVDARGAARALGLSGFTAELTPGNREVLVWTDDLRLLRHTLATGATEVLATSVLEPRLSADGRTLGFARAPGLERLTPGFVACPFTQALGEAARRAEGPCHAQAPFLSPTGRFLYVSTEGGLAGLVADGRRVSGTGAADFVPVPGRELLWLDGDRALYTAHYERSVLWLFDARTRTAAPLFEGQQPALVAGQVLAVHQGQVFQVGVAR